MGLFNFKKTNSKKDNSQVIPGAESVVKCFSTDLSVVYTLCALDGKIYYKNQIIGSYQKNSINSIVVKTNISSVTFRINDEDFKSKGHFYTSFFQVDSLIYSNNPGLLPRHIEKSSTRVSTSLIESKVDETIATYKGDYMCAIAAFVCAHSLVITDSIYHSVFAE